MKRLSLLAVAGAVTVAVLAATAGAFNGQQLAASACGGGKLVINVTQKVTNDRDDGQGGNVWASTSYNRQVQVWQLGPNTFCGTVNYSGGQFQTVAGATTPGATGTFAKSVS